MIRYAKTIEESVVDGVGLRLVVFLQGCIHCCEGCHNPELQKVDAGIEITEKELANLILSKLTTLHAGVTFSGGDPFYQAFSLSNVITLLKKRKPDLNIWVYTGYLYEHLKRFSRVTRFILKRIDVLVDGPFIEEKRDISLLFKGSYNQRIIDVQKSLRTREIVEVGLE